MDVNSGIDSREQRSQLFTLRLWLDHPGKGKSAWRAKVQHVNSGEVRYFRDWSTLETFVEGLISQSDLWASLTTEGNGDYDK